ncbi:DUF3823 domain-containing protein [Chitinophaga sp. GCM10012297]|uniref:DUF3823 domain-containing protein n=1 Tax=Chitinophaga chungangae TaxID=2821488 RepID=A0ABS3YAF1_9BACT|nr:DUF3823 domain-containing protein [Chitinophaga chungangae]MBO9151653.1 DUF3823 domain-containing protein [Chitinophaga chungangae]
MKLSNYIIASLLAGIAATGCKKDNYDPPASSLSGRLLYQGDEIHVEYNQVPYQLYQYGFGKLGPISNTTFDQDGTYSVLLFDGEYKLIIPNGQGPFLWKKTAGGSPDTVVVQMRGSRSLDLEVTPFYMIRNPQFNVAAGKVNGTFSIEKIITDANARNVERVNLYLNRTAFVSGAGNYNVANVSLSGGSITDPGNVALSVTIPSLSPAQSYIYARIGLKVQGVEDMIFSPVIKLDI